MPGHSPSDDTPRPNGRWFNTTMWSVVWRARDADTHYAEEALDKLSRAYWSPLYAYIRRKSYSTHDAQDLTQEFLTRFIQKEWLNHLQDQRSKFRNFLLTLLEHFLADERDRANAQKRGGGKTIVSIDALQINRAALPAKHGWSRRTSLFSWNPLPFVQPNSWDTPLAKGTVNTGGDNWLTLKRRRLCSPRLLF
jgi:hypothetical protein